VTFAGLLRMEAWKLARRGRSYIGPAGLLAIVFPTAIGLRYGPMASELERYVSSSVTVIGSPLNALFIARVVLPPTVFLFLPLFVSIVAGDQISGESAEGTLRALVSRPVHRLKLLAAKYLVSLGYAVGLTAFLGLSALAVGYSFFGMGGLVNFWQGITYFGVAEGLERLELAYALAAAYQLCVCSVAFLLSVFMQSSLAPVGVTFAIMLVMGAVGEIPYFERLKPFFFTTYADLFQKAFLVPLDAGGMVRGVAALAAWTGISFGLAAAAFSRKDILS
jgi:ABC-2 type transport system permease protein